MGYGAEIVNKTGEITNVNYLLLMYISKVMDIIIRGVN